MQTTSLPAVGDLLREWRQRRRLSQLDLAGEADISTRHLSFVESGRAQPSREMVLHLAERLEVPLRERNVLLVAAGYAPVFRERQLADPALLCARQAIDLVLTGHEPYPALAVDRHWTMVASNGAVGPLVAGADASLLQPPINVLRLSLHPEGLAPRIVSGGGTGTHDFDHELGVLTEFQVGSYVFMDVNYRDVVMRKGDPHPFGFALSVRTTVVSAEQPGFVITDAGMKELDAMLGLKYPAILRGAPDGAKYALAGDDMGRIEFTDASDRLAAGDVIDVLPAHCYATLNMYSHYHVVRGDELIDIWPIGARDNW